MARRPTLGQTFLSIKGGLRVILQVLQSIEMGLYDIISITLHQGTWSLYKDTDKTSLP